MRDGSHTFGEDDEGCQVATGRLGNVTKLGYFEDSKEKISAMAYAGFCQRGSLPSVVRGLID